MPVFTPLDAFLCSKTTVVKANQDSKKEDKI